MLHHGIKFQNIGCFLSVPQHGIYVLAASNLSQCLPEPQKLQEPTTCPNFKLSGQARSMCLVEDSTDTAHQNLMPQVEQRSVNYAVCLYYGHLILYCRTVSKDFFKLITISEHQLCFYSTEIHQTKLMSTYSIQCCVALFTILHCCKADLYTIRQWLLK